jgi:hypothetical protein
MTAESPSVPSISERVSEDERDYVAAMPSRIPVHPVFQKSDGRWRLR